ncbi:MAG: C4-dicarboxylate TRAP transporter substrate-binding protein [Gammaproteobacteria bacterium]
MAIKKQRLPEGSRMYDRLCAALLLLLFSAGPAIAEPQHRLDITFATTHPPSLPWVYVVRDFVAPEFVRRMGEQRPDYAVSWLGAWGTLYKWQDSLAGVEVGVADIGWIGSLWESARLPLQNMTYALPFITDDLPALMRVINRLHETIPAMRAGWEKYGTEYLGASGVDTYHLLTTFPVNSLDDLRGRKILAPGAAAIWLQGTGAIAVDGALSTYYTQLKTGVAEGTISILTGAHPFRIHEVAPYVTLVGIGAQCTGALTANRRFWQGLPPEARTILRELGPAYSNRAAVDAMGRYENSLQAMAAEGAIVSVLPAAEKQRWIEAMPNLAREWVARNEAKGLPARQVLEALISELRAEGVEPVFDWTQTLPEPVGIATRQ